MVMQCLLLQWHHAKRVEWCQGRAAKDGERRRRRIFKRLGNSDVLCRLGWMYFLGYNSAEPAQYLKVRGTRVLNLL